MISNKAPKISGQSILLVDHNKFDKISLYTIAEMSDISTVITDQPLDTRYQKEARDAHTKLLVVEDTEVSELQVDEGSGGDGEQCDEAGDQGVARDTDGVRAAFFCKAVVGREINAEQNQYGDNV